MIKKKEHRIEKERHWITESQLQEKGKLKKQETVDAAIHIHNFRDYKELHSLNYKGWTHLVH